MYTTVTILEKKKKAHNSISDSFEPLTALECGSLMAMRFDTIRCDVPED